VLPFKLCRHEPDTYIYMVNIETRRRDSLTGQVLGPILMKRVIAAGKGLLMPAKMIDDGLTRECEPVIA
jgi:hypothetical protein